jgi:hypothetical protein
MEGGIEWLQKFRRLYHFGVLVSCPRHDLLFVVLLLVLRLEEGDLHPGHHAKRRRLCCANLGNYLTTLCNWVAERILGHCRRA